MRLQESYHLVRDLVHARVSAPLMAPGGAWVLYGVFRRGLLGVVTKVGGSCM
jgi:hypothetical protein